MITQTLLDSIAKNAGYGLEIFTPASPFIPPAMLARAERAAMTEEEEAEYFFSYAKAKNAARMAYDVANATPTEDEQIRYLVASLLKNYKEDDLREFVRNLFGQIRAINNITHYTRKEVETILWTAHKTPEKADRAFLALLESAFASLSTGGNFAKTCRELGFSNGLKIVVNALYEEGSLLPDGGTKADRVNIAGIIANTLHPEAQTEPEPTPAPTPEPTPAKLKFPGVKPAPKTNKK